VLPSHPNCAWFEREHGITRADWQGLFSSRGFQRAMVGDAGASESRASPGAFRATP